MSVCLKYTSKVSHNTVTDQVVHETLRVKPMLQWRLQDAGDDRNMGHMPKKAMVLIYPTYIP